MTIPAAVVVYREARGGEALRARVPTRSRRESRWGLPDYDAARTRYPIAISLELEYDVGYIRYREPTKGERLTGGGRLEDPNGDDLDVVVDQSADGIFGIESLGFDPRILDLARTVANRAGLAFPDIAAALAIDEEE